MTELSSIRGQLAPLGPVVVDDSHVCVREDALQIRHRFNISTPGICLLQFYLYKLPNTRKAYRSLFLTARRQAA